MVVYDHEKNVIALQYDCLLVYCVMVVAEIYTFAYECKYCFFIKCISADLHSLQ